jgi:hypothetical protein
LLAVAYEISKPLTVILGSSADTIELLKENAGDVPDHFDEIMENHELIGQKVLLLDGIITDLTDAVVLETGWISLSRQHTEVTGLLFKRLSVILFRSTLFKPEISRPEQVIGMYSNGSCMIRLIDSCLSCVYEDRMNRRSSFTPGGAVSTGREKK